MECLGRIGCCIRSIRGASSASAVSTPRELLGQTLIGGWTGHGEVVLPEVVVPGTVVEHPMIGAWTGQGQPESK